jgi:hypothetical protein
VDRGLVHAVAQHVVDRRVRPVDRELGEVGSAQAGQLRVQVGEQPGLQRVIGDLDPRHEVAEVEGDLLGFREVVRRVAVQRELADQLNGDELFGNEFRGIEQVDPLEGVGAVIGHDLDAQWEEAQIAAGTDPDFHRRNMADGIEAGAFLEYDVCTPKPSIVR